MAKQRISKRAIRQNFGAALEQCLPEGGPSLEEATLAIAYVAWGQGNDHSFNGDKSASQIVQEYQLKPFVEVVRQCNLEAPDQGGISPGDWVIGHGKVFRSLMRREVTIFAMPRFANQEVLLETLEGEYFGFAGEDEVEKLTDTTSHALAEKVREGELEFDQAVRLYLQEHCSHVGNDLLGTMAQIAINQCKSGQADAVVDLPTSLTSARVVELLNLKPFVAVFLKAEAPLLTRPDSEEGRPRASSPDSSPVTVVRKGDAP
jgi:hypothetical protein